MWRRNPGQHYVAEAAAAVRQTRLALQAGGRADRPQAHFASILQQPPAFGGFPAGQAAPFSAPPGGAFPGVMPMPFQPPYGTPPRPQNPQSPVPTPPQASAQTSPDGVVQFPGVPQSLSSRKRTIAERVGQVLGSPTSVAFRTYRLITDPQAAPAFSL